MIFIKEQNAINVKKINDCKCQKKSDGICECIR